MKLHLLHTARHISEGFKGHARSVKPMLQTMPKYKRIHSMTVGRTIHGLGVGRLGTYTALLHDYFERGGDLETLNRHVNALGLPSRIAGTVLALTSSNASGADEGAANQPLDHLKRTLPKLNRGLRNVVILVKMADRLDNLKRRLRRKGKIASQYRKKSRKLVDYLADQYTGNPNWFKKLKRQINAVID